MVNNTSNRGTQDNRWELVEKRDRRGRRVLARRAKVGSRFGELTVLLGGVGNSSKTTTTCSCGAEYEVTTRTLFRGQASQCSSCGHRVGGSKRLRYSEIFPSKDLKRLWGHRFTGMVSRCYNENHKAYPNYGGRGISIHLPWLEDRKLFFEYAKTLENWDVFGLDLDRIDNDRGYVPNNLRLCTRKENSNNRRTSVEMVTN